MTFYKGHKINLDRKHSDETKEKMRLSKLGKNNPVYEKSINVGENNGKWKGDDVGYKSLHAWVRRHLQEPELCEICHKIPPYDLANTTGIYNRQFINWKYLCRSCHMISDGRLKNLLYNKSFEERSEAILKGWKTKRKK